MFYLYNDDCLNVMKKIENGTIDLILVDMPYIISKKSNFDKGGSWNDANDKRCRKTPPKTDFGEWDKKSLDLDVLLKEFYRILKKSGTLIMFYDIYKMQELKETAEKYKFKQPRLCVWQKTNPVPVNSKLNYLSNSREYFITFVKGGSPVFNSEYDNGFYEYPICSGHERTSHPTQKPFKLMDELIKKHTNCDNSVVLDCFMGSGSTGIACIENNNTFIGVELDSYYFKLAKARLECWNSKDPNVDYWSYKKYLENEK